MLVEVTNKVIINDVLIYSGPSPEPKNLRIDDAIDMNPSLIICMSHHKRNMEDIFHPTIEKSPMQGVGTLTVIGEIIDNLCSHKEIFVFCDAGRNRSYNVIECLKYLDNQESDICPIRLKDFYICLDELKTHIKKNWMLDNLGIYHAQLIYLLDIVKIREKPTNL